MTYSEHGDAFFSDDRVYRYALTRVWDNTLPKMMFVGLNPSTADETKLDPTLRRVVRFADREGCGALSMTNLFAFRATKPSNMKAANDPVGPANDIWLRGLADVSAYIVVGWGTHGGYRARDRQVDSLLHGFELKCLGVTKDGHPKHPLYLRKDAPLITYRECY